MEQARAEESNQAEEGLDLDKVYALRYERDYSNAGKLTEEQTCRKNTKIRMSYRRNLFILGAGFSAFAGAPLISNFLPRAQELVEDPYSSLTEEDKQRFRRVLFDYRKGFEASKARLEIDLENLEELFGLIETESQFHEASKTVRDDLLFLIIRTLQATIKLTEERKITARFQHGQQHRTTSVEATVYDFFAKVICTREQPRPEELEGRVSNVVITLNYDNILENSLVRFGVKPDYSLPGAQDLRVLEKDLPTIPFLKLHGSINWQTCDDCGQLSIIGDKGDASQFVCPKCNSSTRPLLVPPTWNKGIVPPLNAVWEQAVNCLSQAERIVAIGYSFPESDKHIKYLFTLGLAQNMSLHEFLLCNEDHDVMTRLENSFFATSFKNHGHLRSTSMPAFQSWASSDMLQRDLDHSFLDRVPSDYSEHITEARRAKLA